MCLYRDVSYVILILCLHFPSWVNYEYSAFDRYNEEVLKSDQRANQSASTEIIGGISRQTSKQPGTYYAICTLDGQFSINFLKELMC